MSSTTFGTYDGVVSFVEKEIPVLFANVFKTTDMNNCSSDKQLILHQSVEIPAGTTVRNCTINQDASLQTRDNGIICVDVNEKLRSLSIEDRNALYDRVIVSLRNKLVQNMPTKPLFVNQFLEKLKETLHNIQPSSQFACTSSILAIQNQKVVVRGAPIKDASGNPAKDRHNNSYLLECDQDSNINISSSLEAYQQMKCISVPVIDEIKRNFILRSSFLSGDNKDCVYQLEQTGICNGSTKTYTAKVLERAKGNGRCVIKEAISGLEGRQITGGISIFNDIPCSRSRCQVSGWEPWSPCYDAESRFWFVENVGGANTLRSIQITYDTPFENGTQLADHLNKKAQEDSIPLLFSFNTSSKRMSVKNNYNYAIRLVSSHTILSEPFRNEAKGNHNHNLGFNGNYISQRLSPGTTFTATINLKPEGTLVKEMRRYRVRKITQLGEICEEKNNLREEEVCTTLLSSSVFASPSELFSSQTSQGSENTENTEKSEDDARIKFNKWFIIILVVILLVFGLFVFFLKKK
jgi:hypothetical protein